MKRNFSLIYVLAVMLLAPASRAKAQPDREAPKKARQEKRDTSYNHLFDIRNIEGWTVYINKKDLADHPQQMQDALDHFGWQLYQVRLNVPGTAAAIMQEKMPLWFEYDTIGIAVQN